MMYERMDCRLCGGHVTTRVSLNPTPIANSFPSEKYAGELFQLELKECDVCKHVQVGHVIDDKTLYGNSYKYFTPQAQYPAMQKQARELRLRYGDRRVLEIGANNGLFIKALREEFNEVMGCDPSTNVPELVAPVAFSMTYAKAIGKTELIVANNVLAHVDDLDAMFEAIDASLTDDGALVFEVQYFMDMAEKGLFDMIYHEHRDYHTLIPLVGFLAQHHLAIKDVERIPNHGGSIRVHCGRGAGMNIVEKTVDWDAFHYRMAEVTSDCLKQVREARSQIIAFGASAKACTLIHQLGIARDISYCVDCTPEKIGKYIAGTAIPIMEEVVLERSKSEKTLLLTAWNYEDIIRSKYPDFNYIVPFRQKLKVAA